MPSGARARFRANVDALTLARALDEQQRTATAEEQAVLAGWSSWGALPETFDPRNEQWAEQREELRALLSPQEWHDAARTTINAHYTDPHVAEEIWTALGSLGFTGGRVLEPGSGSGTFIGLAPPAAQMTGVELDPVTAAISSRLYPHAEIRAESFADTRLARGGFDATVGNVPFGKVTLHDPIDNPTRQSIHNHFILKSLRLTRPGGLVAVLSSHYTLDAQNPGARREMNQLADLVGAVRLPTGTHRRTAGTDAITDLLILRRREEDQPAADDLWETVTPITLDGHQLKINRYFDEHPEHVLGTLGTSHGMYGAETLSVTGDLDHVAADLHTALEQITFTARRAGLTMTERTTPVGDAPPVATTGTAPERWDGTIVATDDGGFGTVNGAAIEPLKVPKNATGEMRALLGLRESATRLLELEAASADDTEEITSTRENLHRDYRKYLGTYGPLNRYTVRRTGRTNDSGEETYARVMPTPLRLLRTDPFGALVTALEEFDDSTQTATPATILTRRVVAPRAEVQGADTPADAVALSLDRTGGIDLTLIADMLGMAEDETRTALDGLVFTDPATDTLVHAPEYLSGDVRQKLAQAKDRVSEAPEFQTNVDALTAVQPEDLGVEDITARFGAVWISPAIHQQFLNEVLRTEQVKVENPLPGMWEVRGGRGGLQSTSEWGTERRPAPDLAKSLMEQKAIIVKDEIEGPDGKPQQVINATETTAAQEKAEQLQARFSEWVWEDPERAQTLVDEYNSRFNNIVLRDYSAAGEYLSLPGVAETFTPRPHQRAAVARMIAEPSTGLFHEVGAGKTAEAIMGAMEMRRMGLINKPLIVIPNHMLAQFSSEWLQIYPQARILAASSKDVTADKRRAFVARAAANDWDGILLTQSAFSKIALRQSTQQDYIRGQVFALRRVLENAEADDAMSVKRLQRKLVNLENKLKERLDTSRDVGVCFEDTGIDYLVIDELHMYKNLATESNISDAAIEGSVRASDLDMKLNYLRSQGNERVVTGMTATPISNSISEAFVMQKYLRPDLLDRAGVDAFDAWAATFGETSTDMEMSPTGSFRLKTRFSRFTNVPEMLRMWSTFADVKTADDLQLPVPEIIEREDGSRAPSTEVVQPTVELEDFVASLGDRAEKVAARLVSPREDNMLTISTDGRKAALDIRLVLDDAPSGPTKVDVAADTIARVWEQTRENEYLDPVTGEPAAARGALQLVFADIGTPNPDRWNAYDELAAQLVLRGMPGESIRFIHEAKTDVDKARLFAAARAGHVAVLVGSTQKMGVGTNIQARAVALYHMDCPWRPSDIAQREGRILRQGNQNEEVGIVRLVTEKSFDAYMWQAVERKARFISQIMHGSLDAREIEEIDSAELSAAEAKAISSGNPLLLEHSTIQAEVAKLHRLERAHSRNESMLEHTRARAREDITAHQDEITGLENATGQVRDTSGENFRMTVAGQNLDSRTDAGQAVAQWAHREGLTWAPKHVSRDYGTLGQISGFDITVSTVPSLGADASVELALAGVPRSGTILGRETFLAGGAGVIQRIENRVSGIPTLLERARNDLDEAEQALADAQERIGRPFRHAAALTEAEQKLGQVEKKLAASRKKDNPDRTPPTDQPAGGQRELTVETVRAHRPALGVRADASRTPPPAPEPRRASTPAGFDRRL
ncbi:helicase-related protein [Kocuria sp. 2SI]|uniref:helicase-related protein n=1 Tax=Kocuria sp. 2SI TaxID=2502203 RepID=UPI0010F4B05D|nr:helicase-related protein [Kocuria sp. 2SI]